MSNGLKKAKELYEFTQVIGANFEAVRAIKEALDDAFLAGYHEATVASEVGIVVINGVKYAPVVDEIITQGIDYIKLLETEENNGY